MKTYTQYETKYKIVNPNGVMLCNKYFENICEAEEEAMALTSINHNTNQGKFERVFIICVMIAYSRRIKSLYQFRNQLNQH